MTLIVDVYHSHHDRDARNVAQSRAFPDAVTSDEIAQWIYNNETERIRRMDLGSDAFAHVLRCVELARGKHGRGDDVEVSIAYWLTFAIHTT